MVLMTATGRVLSWRKVVQEEPEDEDDDKGKRIKTSQTINLTKILRGIYNNFWNKKDMSKKLLNCDQL